MPSSQHFQKILEKRFSRRQVLGGLAGAAVVSALPLPLRAAVGAAPLPPRLFTPLTPGNPSALELAASYEADILLKWGDPLWPDAPAFNPKTQTPEAQARQFGYNNDFVTFLPFDGDAGGLLCVNHEYVNPELMYPDWQEGEQARFAAVDMQAVGMSIVELRRNNETRWQPILGGKYTRRITATTPMAIHGPAREHLRMRTAHSPDGTEALGTLGNCAGGTTPWRTVLTAEENIDNFFHGTPAGQEKDNHKRMGIGKGELKHWAAHDVRFNVDLSPNEPNHFGWIVEVNPFDPASVPKKRTALGRFKHEGATTAFTKDKRVVVYMGDDEADQFLYRFVTARPYNPGDPNPDLLDEGTLSVAQFHENGTMRWLPMIFGSEPLTPANGFQSQADVVIDARHAAALLGATPMDRPEDVETAPGGRVYVSLTNNATRLMANAANPYAPNLEGHVLELIPPVEGHGAGSYRWEIFYPNEGDPDHQLANPDNLTFDQAGNIWIATDGMGKSRGVADGIFALPLTGPYRGLPHRMLNAPRGAEVTGPCFAPDCKTLFLSIQHPGEKSTFKEASTHWPDFMPGIPPRPAVIAIRHKENAVIGTP